MDVFMHFWKIDLRANGQIGTFLFSTGKINGLSRSIVSTQAISLLAIKNRNLLLHGTGFPSCLPGC